MENVPEVVGKNNIEHFKKWEEQLRKFGYSNYVETLNGKNYGIPQNRKRTFMISILGYYAYDFPCKIPLQYRLKDLLEKKVDEKYYLSQKMVDYITATNEKWTGNNGGAIVNKDIGCTINTAPGQRRCDASNYIADDLPDNTDLREVINEDTETNGGGLLIKNATKQGYLEADNGDGIDISSRMDTHRGTVQKGSCQTLTCQGGDSVGVVVDEQEISETDKD